MGNKYDDTKREIEGKSKNEILNILHSKFENDELKMSDVTSLLTGTGIT